MKGQEEIKCKLAAHKDAYDAANAAMWQATREGCPVRVLASLECCPHGVYAHLELVRGSWHSVHMEPRREAISGTPGVGLPFQIRLKRIDL